VGGFTIPEKEKETRNFALRDADGNEIGVYTGKSPRQAALKAANRGYKDIRLRERGTKKEHVFVGERVQVDPPKGAQPWMNAKIWKPNVKKLGRQRRLDSDWWGKIKRVSNIILQLLCRR